MRVTPAWQGGGAVLQGMNVVGRAQWVHQHFQDRQEVHQIHRKGTVSRKWIQVQSQSWTQGYNMDPKSIQDRTGDMQPGGAMPVQANNLHSLIFYP